MFENQYIYTPKLLFQKNDIEGKVNKVWLEINKFRKSDYYCFSISFKLFPFLTMSKFYLKTEKKNEKY
jgi:hypothetical protein